jgi:AsmA protein
MPSGSKLQGGTLTTSLAITGTSDAPVISGPVRLDNTQLAGFDLGSKMSAVTSLTGGKTGNVTTVRVLSLNLHEAGGAIDAQNILLDVTGLGTATGGGTVSAAKALNFNVVAKLSQTGAAGMATTALSMIGGGVGGAASSALKNGVPVAITGTASNPIITPDVRALTKGAANPASVLGKNGKQQIPNNLGNTLGGLLGKH